MICCSLQQVYLEGALWLLKVSAFMLWLQMSTQVLTAALYENSSGLDLLFMLMKWWILCPPSPNRRENKRKPPSPVYVLLCLGCNRLQTFVVIIWLLSTWPNSWYIPFGWMLDNIAATRRMERWRWFCEQGNDQRAVSTTSFRHPGKLEFEH